MRVIATMATLPGRARAMRQAVRSLLPQVDGITVNLNGHRGLVEAPELCDVRVATQWSPDNDGARAKLRAHPDQAGEHHFRLLVDDDILYPPNYVEQMVAGYQRHPGGIVGVHGCLVTEPIRSYQRSLQIAHSFKAPLGRDRRVHILGTATVGFHTADFTLDAETLIAAPNSVDVALACAAKRAGLSLWAIRRPANWLGQLEVPAGETIWETRALAGRDGMERRLLREAAPWGMIRSGR